MTLLNEITKIENGRIFMADRAGDKTAYKKYLIGETLLGKFWIEKDEAVILHEVDSIAKAKAEIDALVGVDKKLSARDSVSPSPQYIVRCLNRDLATKKQRIQYAESIAQAGGENSYVYAEAAEILKKEGGAKDATDEYEVNVGNIGNISCSSKSEALSRFDEYVRQSKASSGRASGEDVVLLKNGEIIREYNGTVTKDGGPGSGVEGHVTSERASSVPESMKSALSQIRVYGEKGAPDVFFRMSKADRDSFDKWLISIKHPLAYEAGTQEHRFKMVAKELSSRQSKDGGPGSGREGHKTHREYNPSRKTLLERAQQGVIASQGQMKFYQSRGNEKEVQAWKKAHEAHKADVARYSSQDGGPGSGQKGHRTSKKFFRTPNVSIVKRIDPKRLEEFKKVMEERGRKYAKFHSKDSSPFSPDEAKAIGETAGVDFTKICPKQFAMGLAVELEHSDLTQGDPIMTAKIVLAHLAETSDYYTKLVKMEQGSQTKDGGYKTIWSEGPFTVEMLKDSIKAYSGGKETETTYMVMRKNTLLLNTTNKEQALQLAKKESEKSKQSEDSMRGLFAGPSREQEKGINKRRGVEESYSLWCHDHPDCTLEEAKLKYQELKSSLTQDGGPGSGQKGHRTLKQRLKAKQEKVGTAFNKWKEKNSLQNAPSGATIRRYIKEGNIHSSDIPALKSLYMPERFATGPIGVSRSIKGLMHPSS